MSVYLGGIVVLACMATLDGGVPAPALVWATASTVTGLIAEREVE